MAHTAAPFDHSTQDLFALLHAGEDSVARRRIAERIVEAHLSLCDTLAGRYRGRGVDHDDLVQVARMALWLAIERYRADQGATFTSYAIPTITGELKRYFRDHCWMIRPPRHLQELRASAVAQRSELEQCLGRELGVDELAHQMDVLRPRAAGSPGHLGQLPAGLARHRLRRRIARIGRLAGAFRGGSGHDRDRAPRVAASGRTAVRP